MKIADLKEFFMGLILFFFISTHSVLSQTFDKDATNFFWSKTVYPLPPYPLDLFGGESINDPYFPYGRYVFSSENRAGRKQFNRVCSFDENSFYSFGGDGYTLEHIWGNGNFIFQFDLSLRQWAHIYGNLSFHLRTGEYLEVGKWGGEPRGRSYHRVICQISNRQESIGEKEIIILGGYGKDISHFWGMLNDLWVYNIDRDQWKWVNGSYTPNTAEIIGAAGVLGQSYIGTMMYFGMTNFREEGFAIIFGGNSDVPHNPGNKRYKNNVFLLNTTTLEFAWLWGTINNDCTIVVGNKGEYNPGNRIGARMDHAQWKMSEDEFGVFGGHAYDSGGGGGRDTIGDLFVFSISKREWKYLSGYHEKNNCQLTPIIAPGHSYNDSSLFPSCFEQIEGVYHNGNVYIFGGYVSLTSSEEYSNLLMYSFDDDMWWNLRGTIEPYACDGYSYYSEDYSMENQVGARKRYSMLHHEDDNGNIVLVIYGGEGYNEYSASRYLLDISVMRRVYICNGYMEDHNNACGENGKCVNFDTCKCNDNWYGSKCDISKCGEYYSNETDVCNEKGLCYGGKCTCIPSYVGLYCEVSICHGVYSNDTKRVCSGHGKCNSELECECFGAWNGDISCSTRNFFSIVAELWYIPTSVTFVILIIITISIVVICIFVNIIAKQRKTIKKVEEIGDIDILLEEKRLEDDISIAHLKVNKKLFEIDYKDIELKKILGSGGSENRVFLVEWKGKNAVFKKFGRKSILALKTQQNYEEFENEVQILASVSHPNILKFYGACLTEGKVGILLEFAELGEVGTFLLNFKEKNGFSLHLNEKIRILKEVSQAMNHLHSLSIIHRDLKAENVLIMDKTLTAKVMDFGISKIVQSDDVKTRRVGTSFYMSPEVFKSGTYDSKCDVFSFGILCYVIIGEKLLPYGDDEKNVEMKVSENPKYRPNIDIEEFKSIPKWIMNMMVSCWDHDSKNRHSFTKILEIFKKNL